MATVYYEKNPKVCGYNERQKWLKTLQLENATLRGKYQFQLNINYDLKKKGFS